MQKQVHLHMQAQVREAGVINGFCYPYARLLLNRLLSLKESGQLFSGAVPTDGGYEEVTTIGETVLRALCEQFPQIVIDDLGYITSEELDTLTGVAKDFLSTFEDY